MPTAVANSPKAKVERLFEEAYQSTASSRPQVDRDTGIIRNVKVLGSMSRNGREYSQAAQKQACKILEGIQVNIDHNRDNPNRERGFMESVGTLHGLYMKPDGVYAKEFRVKKAHPAAQVIFESAENFPKSFGLSINAEGEVAKRGGRWVVGSIDKAHSVDVVGKPATTNGLFESEEPRKAKPVRTLRKLFESLVGHDDIKARFTKLIEDGGDSATPYMDESLDPGPTDHGQETNSPADVDQSQQVQEAAPDDDGFGQEPLMQINEAFKALVAQVMDNADLDIKSKITQITAILKLQDQLMHGPAAGSPSSADLNPDVPTDGGETLSTGQDDANTDDTSTGKTNTGDEDTVDDEQAPAQKSKTQESLLNEISDLKRVIVESWARQDRLEARQRLIESQRVPTDERVDAFLKADTEDKRVALIESWAPERKPSVPKPRISPPAFNPTTDAVPYPRDSRGFASAVKS